MQRLIIKIIYILRSNLAKGFVQYTQFFPEKSLEGQYTINSKLMNNTGANNGSWNLTLCKYSNNVNNHNLINVNSYLDITLMTHEISDYNFVNKLNLVEKKSFSKIYFHKLG